MRIANLFSRYEESGNLSSLINVFGFIDHEAFLTKRGDVGLVLGYNGKDSECLEPAEIERITTAVRSALLTFDDRFIITQYLVKQSNPELENEHCANGVVSEMIRNRRRFLHGRKSELYSFETFVVVVCKAKWGGSKLREQSIRLLRNPKAFFANAFDQGSRNLFLDETITFGLHKLRRAVANFLEQTADDLAGRILPKGEAFAFLRRLLNPNNEKADSVELSFDSHVDFFAVDSELECHRDHLRLDNYFLRTLTLKHPPASTNPDFLRALLRTSGNITVALSWNPVDSVRAASLVRAKRRHFHNTKSGMFTGLTQRPYEREMLFDDSKEALVADLGRCLEQIEVHGLRLGELTLTVLLTAKELTDLDQSAAEVLKIFGRREGALNEERYNGLNAYLAALPGGYPFDLRKLLVSNQNHVDLGFWFLPSRGERRNTFLNAEYLFAFETEDRSLYFYNLHVGDVGHTVVVGPTGTGKSFLLNVLLAIMQKYNPATIIYDVGGSYRRLTGLFGGVYIQVRPDALPFSINPFSLEPSARNLEFIYSFCTVLIEQGGYKMDDSGKRDLFEAVRSMYVLDPDQRRLFTLATTVKREIGNHLKRWTEGEQYGRWFDNVSDTVSYSRFQCVDFEGMDKLGVVLEPLLFYLLFRADEAVYDVASAKTLKVFVADEAWRFFRHPLTRAYIIEALKTWRKKNAAVILATQSIEDLAGTDLLRTVAESCPTKLLLGNPTLDSAVYESVFGLSATEREHVRRLLPKKQLLLKRNGFSKVLNLNVDPESHRAFTTNPFEMSERNSSDLMPQGLHKTFPSDE